MIDDAFGHVGATVQPLQDLSVQYSLPSAVGSRDSLMSEQQASLSRNVLTERIQDKCTGLLE